MDVDWGAGPERRKASGRCVDLSACGARITVPGNVPVSSEVHLRFVEDLNLEAYAVVRHTGEQGSIGVEFTRLIWRGSPIQHRRMPLAASIGTPLTIIAAIAVCLILFPGLLPDWHPFAAKEISPPAPLPRGVFTLGSTRAEVREAQGPPARMSGPVWYYGTSTVYFESGRVAGWSQSSDKALKVGVRPHKQKTPREDHLAVGATPEEVMAVVGPPTKLTKGVWKYGQSEVYFREGHVVGWKNSPTRPLQATDS